MQSQKPRKTVCFTIKSSWHAISRLYNEQAVKHNLSAAMGFVLLNIDGEKGTPATKIGPLTGTEAKSLSRMLKSLEKDGLIVKKQNPNDKRQIGIFLTEKGKQKREIAKEVVRKFNAEVSKVITEEKLAVFYEVMGEINHLIETRNIYTTQKHHPLQ